jgi:hypothetical protein
LSKITDQNSIKLASKVTLDALGRVFCSMMDRILGKKRFV